MDKLLLTGKIANFESSINDLRVELESNRKKLEIAYDYKDSLYGQMKTADRNIKELQLACFRSAQEIADVVDKIKKELSLYEESVM